MANQPYPNFVLENKLTNLLNTKLNVRSIASVDNDLTEAAGMIKKVNVYTYDGTVEEVAIGEGNTVAGSVSYTPVQYTVGVSQQQFIYQDEDIMQDPKILDAGMEGSAQVMINDLNDKVFAEYAKATNTSPYSETGLNYDSVVDAIAKMNVEDESGLFLVIGINHKAQIRKDEDFKSARLGEILFNGQIGSIAGIPVIVSKLVPADAVYLATKEAVTIFVKKESEVEQERDANTRTNKVFLRKVALVALTDNGSIVKLVKE